MESEKLTSPDIQRHAIQTYAAHRGDQVIKWVEGIDESGSRAKSAWWAKLDYAIACVERGEADVILVWKFSRTARHRLRWAVALDRVDQAGGAIESATEQTDPTPSGRFARGMIGEMNAYQAELIGEVWRETHERRRRNGLPPTGGPRFGYTVVDGVHTPDPVEGPVLADLYRWYLSGMGAAQLTRKLNDMQIGGRRWTYQGVMNVLDSGFGAGKLGRTKPHILPPWERDYAPGIHSAVIDEETWSGYVAQRLRRYRVPTRTPLKYLLTGLVRCGDCGGPMSGKVFDGRPTYTCSRSTTTNLVKRVTMVAWRAERIVEEWVLSLSGIDESAAAAEAVAKKVKRGLRAADALRHDIARQNERLSRLGVMVADGAMTTTEYRLAADAIHDTRAALERRLVIAAGNPVEEAAPAAVSPDLLRVWPRMTIEQRASVLRPLLAHLVIYPAAHRGSVERRTEVVARWEVD